MLSDNVSEIALTIEQTMYFWKKWFIEKALRIWRNVNLHLDFERKPWISGETRFFIISLTKEATKVESLLERTAEALKPKSDVPVLLSNWLPAKRPKPKLMIIMTINWFYEKVKSGCRISHLCQLRYRNSGLLKVIIRQWGPRL